ncbi:hypothetical protein KUTeg_017586 [Tegillarca granosa]|uniref:Amine oxidase n=1 Tax=Tegillarca granosa TaxID=220873 RepID=A0ABQ9EL85_TEGGR|nr:hypothetical protein KUTeg_017586 [Tegillarca granosa]
MVQSGTIPDCIEFKIANYIHDLVAWITLGTYHIPHTEDLPVTHTPGKDMNLYLLPFNYYPQNPAMHSRNAIRIDPTDEGNISKDVNTESLEVDFIVSKPIVLSMNTDVGINFKAIIRIGGLFVGELGRPNWSETFIFLANDFEIPAVGAFRILKAKWCRP